MHLTRSNPVRRTLALVAGALLAVGTGGAPANASGGPGQAGGYVQPPTPYHDSGTEDAGCPNVKATIAYADRGVSSIRRARGTHGQAFFLTDRYRFSETWTETTTGKVLFTFRGRARYQEVRARQVPKADVPADAVPAEGLTGPIFRFTAVERSHDVLRDADGTRLYRDAGVVVWSQLFDSLGDHAPGGTTLTNDPVKVKGPHPLLDVDLCDVAARQAG